MNIIVINGSTDLYGANRILSLSVRNLSRYGKVTLLLPDLEGPLVQYFREHNPGVELKKHDQLPIIQRSMFSPRGILQLLKSLTGFYRFLKQEHRREKVDLIYVNTLSNFFVLPIARRLGIKTLTHVHEILESPKPVTDFINKNTVGWSDHILAVSNAVKENLLKYSRQRGAEKVSVIYNGIPDMYLPKINTDEASNKTMITYIGRIKPEKGVWYFLEALKMLADKSSVCVRVIGGPAPLGEGHVERLKEDIMGMDLEITYLPFMPDVKKYLNETHILVVPSVEKDSFPTTVLEGMSAGKAVIATDMGGAVEAIVDRTSGFIIGNNDPRRFAETLTLLIRDDTLLKKVGEEARKRYLAKFSTEEYHRNMEAFYAKVLD